jgi:hypothetical protein
MNRIQEEIKHFSKLGHIKYLKIFILLIIPILLFLIALSIKQSSGPYWLGSNSDPEYPYLLNSLNLSRFKKISFILHPGTTVEVIGAGVILPIHIIRGGFQGLSNDVLGNPELYLNAVSYFFILLTVLSLFAVGLLTFLLTGSLFFSLIIQLTPFLSVRSIVTLNRVSPEPLLLITCLWFSYLILYLYRIKHKSTLYLGLAFSVISGFFVATKFNALPIVLIPFILLPAKDRIFYCVSTLVAFVLFTLPISGQYLSVVKWLNEVVFHSNTSPEGFPLDLRLMVDNLKSIMAFEKFLTVIIALVAIILLFQFIKSRYNHASKYLLSLLIFFIIQVVFVTKRFSIHYLVPSLGLLGVTIIIIFAALTEHRPSFFQKCKYIVLPILIIYSFSNILIVIGNNKERRIGQQDAYKINRFVEENFSGHIRVSYYRSSSQEYALKFGNEWAGNLYGQPLSELYPSQFFYNIWARTYENWTTTIQLPDKDNIVFQGTPFEGDHEQYKPKYKLEDVYIGKSETVYVVK